MKSINPEEKTAKYYDIVYADWMNDALTQEELTLISSYLTKPASIIDIGCGSGRHLIPLYKIGYNVLGIEPLKSMLQIIQQKEPTVPVINSQLLIAEIHETFDLAIILWNTFTQLAYTETEALQVFQKLYQIIKPTGKIIIGISSGENAQHGLTFEHTIQYQRNSYLLSWKVNSFDSETNTTTCTERIQVKDQLGNVMDDVSAAIKQRWWRENEIRDLCNKINFNLKIKKLAHLTDLYYIFSK